MVETIVLRLYSLVLFVLIVFMPLSSTHSADNNKDERFEIKSFEVIGNSIFPDDKLKSIVAPFTGQGKTAADVEKARDKLEKLYHDAGYPAVIVNIPEQTLKDGIVRLQVIESRIGQVKITGNRYFTREKLMKDLPALTPGRMLYLPDLQKEISRLNSKQDINVEPIMTLGKEFGTIDVELKVEDKLPLHGYLELNNRSYHDSKELRLNTMIRYDNLWQKEHSGSLQYQTAPQKPKEVQVIGGSYILPAPWENDHQIVFFGIWSDSDTAFGEGFRVIGSGEIFGIRYVIPLPQYRLYAHNLTMGIDYKHFNQAIGFTTESGETTQTPVSYLPLSLSYNSSLPDKWGGVTQFNAGINLSIRGLVSDQKEFELKRFKGKANYLYANFGIQRTQKLPRDFGLFVKLDGQLSDQPLIDNEQYSAGGMENVRGYKETEALGDNALHSMVEISFPDPVNNLRIGKHFQMNPFIFYDFSKLSIKEPLPDQDSRITLQGIGAGIRGSMLKQIEYEVDWGIALNSTDKTEKNKQRIYFKVKTVF